MTAFRDGEVTLRVNRRTDGFTEALQEIGYHGVRTGDLVIHSMDGFAGAIGVSDSDGKVSPVVHAYETPNADARFLAYSLRVAAWSGYIQSLARGIRERSTAFDPVTFKYMLLPQPPVAEQRAIADFVDRETAKIDALIAKQNEMIALLRERHVAAMSRATGFSDKSALSRGNPVAGWRGHRDDWARAPLRALLAAPVTDGPHETPDFLEDGVPFLSVDGIQDGELVFEGCRHISPEDHMRYAKKAMPRKGDVLMGKAASTGKIAQVRVDFEFNVWSPLAILRPRPGVSPDWLTYALKAHSSQVQIDLLCTNNTQKNIAMADIPRIVLPVPPPGEQRKIAAQLDRETAKIDALITKAEEHIALAQERRGALITAAVTGQLDVTGKVA